MKPCSLYLLLSLELENGDWPFHGCIAGGGYQVSRTRSWKLCLADEDGVLTRPGVDIREYR